MPFCYWQYFQVWVCSDSFCIIVNAIGELLDAQTEVTSKTSVHTPDTASCIMESGRQTPSGRQSAGLDVRF